jgi:hypothetical protein
VCTIARSIGGGDTLTASFGLGVARLDLMSTPAAELDVIRVQLIVTRQALGAKPCSGLSLLVNEQPLEATELSWAVPNAVELAGQVRFEGLKPLAASTPSMGVSACGQTWKLSNEQIGKLKEFLKQVSALAREFLRTAPALTTTE